MSDFFSSLLAQKDDELTDTHDKLATAEARILSLEKELEQLSALCDDALSIIIEHHSSAVMRDEHHTCTICSKMPHSLKMAFLCANRNKRNTSNTQRQNRKKRKTP